MKKLTLSFVAACLTLLLISCGGGGGGGSSSSGGSGGSSGVNSSIATAVKKSAPISSCPNGGITVYAGIDTNGNGILDTSEITSTQYVCNGSNGMSALILTTYESPGANCANGGERVSIGLDSNANGVLELSEITASYYICNGVSGGGITWLDVTGTAQQAVSNTGYIADNASQVSITLPATPAVGDIVKVSGVGTGGWQIEQNAAQSIITGNIDTAWTSHDSLRNWQSVASSSDGTKLVAVEYGGMIYTSADSGANWAARNVSGNWYSVASSSDGTKLVVVENIGMIYTSADSGVSWTSYPLTRQWVSVASSSDGTKLVAVTGGSGGEYIYTSTDSGASWSARASIQNWAAVASSSDGTKLIAVASGTAAGDRIYTSIDSGVSWTARGSVDYWRAVASSANGTKLVAMNQNGLLYTSSDSGVSWAVQQSLATTMSLASSSDGSKLVASGAGNYIYTSSDSGASWALRNLENVVGRTTSVASTSDGNKIIGVGPNSKILTAGIYVTTTGIPGSISGGQYDAIELQYSGNNQFIVLSHQGAPTVQ